MKAKSCLTLGCAALAAVWTASAAVTTIRVPSDQATITNALSAESGATKENPYEILLAEDTYTQTATLTIPSYVTLKGDSTDRTKVVVSGAGSLDAKSGLPNIPVIILQTNAMLAGLTVKDGCSNASSAGGVTLVKDAVLTNCLITACRITQDTGGGVFNNGGLVTHCRISECTRGAAKKGMGLRQAGTTAITEHCEIINNLCTGNSSTGITGAGAYVTGGLVSYCIISNNVAGAIQGQSTHNGGVYLENATLDHCLVAGNVSMYKGGVEMYNDGKTTTPNTIVRHCTIVGNRSQNASGIRRSAANAKKCIVVNSIVVDNYATFPEATGNMNFENVDASNMSITGLCSNVAIGEGALAKDPIFVDPEHGDYRLAQNSPCRNAGVDDEGNKVDLGYMPYDGAASREVPTYEQQANVYVSLTGSATPPFATPETATSDILAALKYAGDGTTVHVATGSYTVVSEILLDKAITLVGAGAETTTVTRPSTTGIGRVLHIAHTNALAMRMSFSGGNYENAPIEQDTGAVAAISYGTASSCVFKLGKTVNAQYAGAGGVANSNGLIADCVISDCTDGGSVGCGYHQEGSAARIVGTTITRCTGSHNYAVGAGAYLAAGLMDRCRIVANICSGSSSGIGCLGTLGVSGATVRNTLIADNYSTNRLGRFAGIYIADTKGTIIDNCTIVSNRANAAAADGVGGGVLCPTTFKADNVPTIRNTVVFGNTVNNYAGAPELCETRNLPEATAASNNASTKGFPIGTGCLVLDAVTPQFCETVNYTPVRNGALLDAGAKLEWMDKSSLDLVGRARIVAGHPDIGAVEVPQNGLSVILR